MDVVLYFIASMLMTIVSGNYPFPIDTGYDPYAFLPRLCRGNLKDSPVETAIDGCSPIRRFARVSSPARIAKIQAYMNIQYNGEPGLTIVFEALSPNSAQIYSVNVVLDDSGNTPMYCGEIETPNPNSGNGKFRHKFRIDLNCPSHKLRPGEKLRIEVITGPSRRYYTNQRKIYVIPGCSDRTMAQSKQCKELAMSKVNFKLKQVGNGTLVTLDAKSAYQNDKRTTITLQLRLKQNGYLNGWKPIGQAVVLKFPKRRHLFTGLTPGSHYSVLAWRNSEERRYYHEIILKREIKKVGK